MKLGNFGVLVIVMLAACKPEPPTYVPFDHSPVSGSWKLTFAERNGKTTETLDQTYFKITEDSMTTNIFGEDARVAIGWSDSLIYPVDSAVVYKVEKVSSDSLQLSFTLQRFNFNIYLEKDISNDFKIESASSN